MKSLPMKWRNPTCPKILRKRLKFIRMRAGCTTADKKPIMLGFWFKIYNLLKIKIIHLLVYAHPLSFARVPLLLWGKRNPRDIPWEKYAALCYSYLILLQSLNKRKHSNYIVPNQPIGLYIYFKSAHSRLYLSIKTTINAFVAMYKPYFLERYQCILTGFIQAIW